MEVRKGEVLVNGLSIGLDHANKNNDLVFISHSHLDHLARTSKKVFCSEETAELALCRGRSFNEVITNDFSINDCSFKMLNSGHVLGSKALLLNNGESVLYTGDFCTRDRFFLSGFKPEKCDTLIIESTFGHPDFVFPPEDKVLKEVEDVTRDYLNGGESVLLMGYALGKAQLACKLAQKLLVPVFAHDAIHNINCVHEKHGICLNCKKVSDYKNESPCIIISPLLSARNQFRFGLKSLGFKSIAFSGWSLLSDFGKRLGVDHAFPLSDHADFNELLLTVKKCNPKRVFTHHGFAGEFAEFLRLEGFDAKVI